jgi:hypothetical protein
MVMKILRLIGVMILMNTSFTSTALLGANEVTFSLVELGGNVVVLRMCANVDMLTPPTGSRWTTASFVIRVVPSASAPFVAGSGLITGSNFDMFGGFDLFDNVSGTTTPTLQALPDFLGSGGMCVDDGNLYFNLLDAIPASGVDNPLTAGQCVDLFTMTFPPSFQCADCIQLVTANIPCTTVGDAPVANNLKLGYSFTLGDTDANLPVELLTFETRANKCDLSLYWETATERNFGYFQIEASKDGRAFATAAQQKPASPNSSTLRTYRYAVPTDLHNQYFRLKAVDLDGNFEYSPIVFAKAPCKDKRYEINLYPNPNYTSELTVEVNSPEAVEDTKLLVMDVFGKQVLLQKVNIQVGVNKLPINTEQLPSGTYFVKIVGIDPLQEPLKFVRSNF